MTYPHSIYLMGSDAVQDASHRFERTAEQLTLVQQWEDESRRMHVMAMTELVERMERRLVSVDDIETLFTKCTTCDGHGNWTNGTDYDQCGELVVPVKDRGWWCGHLKQLMPESSRNRQYCLQGHLIPTECGWQEVKDGE